MFFVVAVSLALGAVMNFPRMVAPPDIDRVEYIQGRDRDSRVHLMSTNLKSLLNVEAVG